MWYIIDIGIFSVVAPSERRPRRQWGDLARCNKRKTTPHMHPNNATRIMTNNNQTTHWLISWQSYKSNRLILSAWNTSVMPTSGTPQGLLFLSFLAWLCALLNYTGSQLLGWRLIGLPAILTTCSHPGLLTILYIILRSMLNLGASAAFLNMVGHRQLACLPRLGGEWGGGSLPRAYQNMIFTNDRDALLFLR